MSAKHTPGPWAVHGHHIESETTGFWIADAIAAFPEHSETQAENARRIVACVNACEGIETSELEEIAVSGGMLGPREDVARIAKQRDELLMALQLALPALEYLRKQFPRSEHDDSIDALAVSKAAIAKSTGEPQ